MMPLNGLKPEPALGSASIAEGGEDVKGASARTAAHAVSGFASADSSGAGPLERLSELLGAGASRHAVRQGASRLRRWHVVCAAVIIAALALGLCWRYLPDVYAWLSNPDAVHAYVEQHGVLSRIAIVGINTLQIVLAFLPGEPIELASGYAFGFWEGTAVCLVASGLGSSLVYWAVRRWGWKVMGLFFTRDQFERFSWLKDARKLELIMLIIFLIPGTPKDFLTYFAGLTRMRFGAVLAIATVGRIPSIVTSTIAASAFGAGEYGIMIGSMAVAVLLAVLGAVAYKALEGRARR